MKPILFALPGNEEVAGALSGRLDGEIGQMEVRRFPDGESYIRIDTDVADRPIILVCTLDDPDTKILPLAFLAETARELGASAIGLVSPYLAYMRQDRRFQPGEAVTSKYFASFLSNLFDWMITVDPHLHRRSSLSEIYSIPATSLHAAPLVSDWIAANVNRPVVIGPDEESEQWVSAVAERAGAPYRVLEKVRRGDRDVEVRFPNPHELAGCTPVLVDDIISTARTMAETIRHIREADLAAPICIGVHAVFADGAFDALVTAGAAKVVTCNTISHPTNEIEIADLISDGIRERNTASAG